MFEINSTPALLCPHSAPPEGPAPRFPTASVFVGLAALTTAREFISQMLTPDYRASSVLTFSEP
jgi:hypothetical protein